MLTRLSIRNFKMLKDTGEIPLDSAVVFIGPNNTGKTTALQALTLWHIGLVKWLEKKGGKTSARERTAVPINRKDIFAIPTPSARYLWNDLSLRIGGNKENGTEKQAAHITIDILVEGLTNDIPWTCGLEFDYSNEEVLYCRPMRSIKNNSIIDAQDILKQIRIAYLQPMSGLVSQEPRLLPATVTYRIGEGRTAEVLRNLCYQILYPETPASLRNGNPRELWNYVGTTIESFFMVKLQEPVLNERGEVELSYSDRNGQVLDISSSGRGLQQVLLLIVYLLNNPQSVLLLDEPDAHLEILRQRQTYNFLIDLARRYGSQIIAASHSEVVLTEAAEKDSVIAFIGKKPHRINDKGMQLMKSLKTIGFENYYQAELKKWVLYLEGSADLAILRTFAKITGHAVSPYLEMPFVHYVATNIPAKAREHFFGLKEAVPCLKGVAIFDAIDALLRDTEDLRERMWTRMEIENYLFIPEVLIKFVKNSEAQEAIDLFSIHEQKDKAAIMQKSLAKIIPQIARENPDDEYWIHSHASEQIERIFKEYYRMLDIPNQMNKNKLFFLAELMTPEQIHNEVKEKLDLILDIASSVTDDH